MSPDLTDDEIARITHPLTQGAARCRFLRGMGLVVKSRPNGQPCIGRAHFEEVMRGRSLEAANDPRPAPADWGKFKERVKFGRGAKA